MSMQSKKFRKAEQSSSMVLFIDCAIFFGLLGVLLCDPSMAFGRAVGFTGIAIVASAILVPFLGAAFVFKRILISRFKFPRNLIAYSLATILVTIIANTYLIKILDRNTDAVAFLIEQKIRYFCLAKFNDKQCVAQVNACKKCADRIGNLDRQSMADELKKHFKTPEMLPHK
ncbi:MAG: hypothetical protein ACXVA9_04295 [Bdellovibrionales bacterium]